jgi:hypothetical protein
MGHPHPRPAYRKSYHTLNIPSNDNFTATPNYQLLFPSSEEPKNNFKSLIYNFQRKGADKEHTKSVKSRSGKIGDMQ